jgi:hypothetical protein
LAEYKSLVNYAGNFVDTLLFIHYIAVLLLEIRHLKPTFYLKVSYFLRKLAFTSIYWHVEKSNKISNYIRDLYNFYML